MPNLVVRVPKLALVRGTAPGTWWAEDISDNDYLMIQHQLSYSLHLQFVQQLVLHYMRPGRNISS